MKLSKKYVKKIKKKLLRCISGITICLVLIAGYDLAGFSTPISNLKNFLTTKSNTDESKIKDITNLEQTSIGEEFTSERR